MSKEHKLPISLDVGLKAELKAEVPAESSGRTLDALTDLIRPLSEWAGFHADKIRLQREDVLLKIAQKALKRRNLALESVPVKLKFLVPLLEKASTENLDSSLVDWWANLLASATQAEEFQQPIFTDFLSKLTPIDADFLDKLWNSLEQVSKPNINPQDYIVKKIRNRTVKIESDGFESVENFETGIREAFANLVGSATAQGVLITRVKFPSKTIGSGELQHFDLASDHHVLERCLIIGVLKREQIYFDINTPFIGSYDIACEVICFSSIGSEFMKACHG